MIEFTLDELMEIHQLLIKNKADPELSKIAPISDELMCKVIQAIENKIGGL